MYINQVDLLFDVVAELISLLGEDNLSHLVKKNPNVITIIKNPSEELVKYVIEQNAELIEYIENPSENNINIALKSDPTLIRFIKTPPLQISLNLIKKDIVKFLPLINNKDENFYNEILKINPFNIQYIPKEHISPSMYVQFIENDPDFIGALSEEDQTDELCLLAVKLKGRCLRHVKRQNYEIIIEAIENDINAFKYFDDKILSQTEIDQIKKLVKHKKAELSNLIKT